MGCGIVSSVLWSDRELWPSVSVEAMPAFVFLPSENAPLITGAAIAVDGAKTAQ